MDFHAGSPTGPVEVGYSLQATLQPKAVIWQAHVSTLEGECSPSASMLAVATAAAALVDIASRAGGNATIERTRLTEEPWQTTELDDDVPIGLSAGGDLLPAGARVSELACLARARRGRRA